MRVKKQKQGKHLQGKQKINKSRAKTHEPFNLPINPVPLVLLLTCTQVLHRKYHGGISKPHMTTDQNLHLMEHTSL